MTRGSTLGRVWLWAPPLAYMALIFYLSAQPDPVPLLTETVRDKWLHLGGYAVLAALFSRALAGERLALATALLCAFAAASAYGASDEWHQRFTAGRSADVVDWIADTAGAGLGAAAYGAWQAGLRTGVFRADDSTRPRL
ncbi:MAG: VanZ family protein [Acidobacteria bacterium]|nr:VanZ family protein [Acidobacteriota bacterium]